MGFGVYMASKFSTNCWTAGSCSAYEGLYPLVLFGMAFLPSGRGNSEKVGRWALAKLSLWRELNPSPVLGILGCYPWNIFWKYRCKSVQFGACCGHLVIKSGTENWRFSIPLLKVGWNLPSLAYSFRGPWSSHSNSESSSTFRSMGQTKKLIGKMLYRNIKYI